MNCSPSTEPVAGKKIETAAPAVGFKPGTKQAAVVEKLNRDIGASLADLTVATGWLPHTVRAALTSLRKRGLTTIRRKIDGVTRYTIGGA